MPGKTFAETVSDSKVMIAGLKSNITRVGKRGLDEAFVAGFNDTLDQVEQLNNEQEALKASLKSKTSKLDAAFNELEDMYSEAKKVVKLEMEKESWREFGMDDKQ